MTLEIFYIEKDDRFSPSGENELSSVLALNIILDRVKKLEKQSLEGFKEFLHFYYTKNQDKQNIVVWVDKLIEEFLETVEK